MHVHNDYIARLYYNPYHALRYTSGEVYNTRAQFTEVYIHVEVANDMDILHDYLSFCSTRTCYRTCFEDGVCKSFVTDVNEQPLKVDVQHANFTVRRIFSPRYNKKNKNDYRKSTNCRYVHLYSLCDDGHRK